MINIAKKEQGFTLIELMIVVAIIGILAAIAIPQFSSYRVKAFNAAAQSDLHSAQTTFEVFFNDNNRYPATVAAATNQITLTDGASASTTMNTSKTVFFSSFAPTDGQSYGAATKHTAGDIRYTTTNAVPTIAEDTSATAGSPLGDVSSATNP